MTAVADAHGELVEALDARVRAVVRREGVDPQADAGQVRRIAEAAVREAEAIIAAHPDDYRAWMLKAHALAMLGQGDAARRAAERALATEIATRDLVLRSELQVVTMQVSGLLGEVEPLAESLERYLSLPMKYWRFDGLMRLPELRQHRAHPAIQALAHRYASDGGRP